MHLRLSKSVFFLIFALISMVGCAILGGGESKIQRADSYELSTPSTWKQIGAKGDSDRAYKLPSGNSVSVTSQCDRNKDANLKVLTRQLLIGTRNIKNLNQQEILIPSGLGLFTTVEASSEGTPFFLGLAVVKKLGCVFDFSLISPKPLNKDEVKDFLNFVKSIQYGTN